MLLALLERMQSPRRTVIVLTSDHGEEFFDHGDCFHIQTLYREIVHVPLIVHVPGVPPRRVPEIVPASVSIAPTVLDLLGVGPRRREGPSLASVVEGRKRPGFEYVVSETAIRYRSRVLGRVRALTGERDKLIHWVAENRTEYFDRLADPLERRPLASPARSRALLHHLDLWLAAHPPRPDVVLARPLSIALKRELRLMGYVD
jgi:arylsulfatase A-like enzyme